jgi:hypothetical protein
MHKGLQSTKAPRTCITHIRPLPHSPKSHFPISPSLPSHLSKRSHNVVGINVLAQELDSPFLLTQQLPQFLRGLPSSRRVARARQVFLELSNLALQVPFLFG